MHCVYFARHGETVWNVENKICGMTDSPLTEKGRAQAAQLGEAVKNSGIVLDEILYSPLSRRGYRTGRGGCHRPARAGGAPPAGTVFRPL